jgi:hypothetical protein
VLSAAIDATGNIILAGERGAVALLDLAHVRMKRHMQLPDCLNIVATRPGPSPPLSQLCVEDGTDNLIMFQLLAQQAAYVQRNPAGYKVYDCNATAIFAHLRSCAPEGTAANAPLLFHLFCFHPHFGVLLSFTVATGEHVCVFAADRQADGTVTLRMRQQFTIAGVAPACMLKSACFAPRGESGATERCDVLLSFHGSNVVHRFSVAASASSPRICDLQIFFPLSGGASATLATLPAASAMNEPRLVLLCGSHLNSALKVELFGLMLQSVAAQRRPTPLWISQSYSDPRFKAKAALYFKRFLRGAGNQLVPRKKRYRQFEHIHYLVNTYAQSEDWFAFLDDDDQVGVERTAQFAQLAQQYLALPASAPQRRFPYVGIQAERNTALPPSTRAQLLLTSLHFEKLPSAGEFVSYCVRSNALKLFLGQAHPDMLRERLCDMLFARCLDFFGRQAEILGAAPTASNEYCYWDGVEGQAHRTRVAEGEEPPSLAMVMHEELVRFCADEIFVGTVTSAAEIDRAAFRQYFDGLHHSQWGAEHTEVLDELVRKPLFEHILTMPSMAPPRVQSSLKRWFPHSSEIYR